MPTLKNKLFHAQNYLHYKIFSWHKNGHGIHSPFVYDLVRNVFMQKAYTPKKIENYRKQLRNSRDRFIKTDFGTGASEKGQQYEASVRELARTNLLKSKHAKLLFKLCKYFNVENAVELGTSFGITTSYLAHSSRKVHTFEGCPETIGIARNVTGKQNLFNVLFIEGNFDETLDKHLPETIDFAYIDGNHSYNPTIEYFNKIIARTHKHSIVVFNDIYLSQEMNRAWEEIKTNEKVSLSVDVFELGMVFFREGVRKQDFTIRY